MYFNVIKLTLLSTLIAVANADIIAFSGNVCDGDQGSNVRCDGSCIRFASRHSYRVLLSGGHCVTYYQNTGCTVNVGSAINPGNGACTNVNTGTAVGSIRCSPNNVCQNSSRLGNGTTAAETDESAEIKTPQESSTALY